MNSHLINREHENQLQIWYKSFFHKKVKQYTSKEATPHRMTNICERDLIIT